MIFTLLIIRTHFDHKLSITYSTYCLCRTEHIAEATAAGRVGKGSLGFRAEFFFELSLKYRFHNKYPNNLNRS